jgi:G3E family GTPase
MVGGFLGAGKTTAMIKLATHLRDQGRRIGLITNDQGRGLVDTARAQAAGFDVEEVTGSCFCCQFDSLAQACAALAQRTAPDFLIAEPVGSCTDLQATVIGPLRLLYGERYRLAPLSVLIDPLRCAGIFALNPDKHFSDKVRYIYRKQLEEAQVIVINKTDLLGTAAHHQLRTALATEFPAATIFAVSCQTGAGLDTWFNHITQPSETSPSAAPSSLDIDYDDYALGEARLGWLNATAQLSAGAAFDGNALLLNLAQRLRQRLIAANAALAHLKMALAPRDGNDLAAISLTRSDEPPQATHHLAAPLARGQLTINLRAEAPPELLERLLRETLASLESARAALLTCYAFRPGRPQPTHRLANVPPGD